MSSRLQPATQEQVVAAFEAFAAGLPDVIAVSEGSGLLSTEALIATLIERTAAGLCGIRGRLWTPVSLPPQYAQRRM